MSHGIGVGSSFGAEVGLQDAQAVFGGNGLAIPVRGASWRSRSSGTALDRS